jgi:hypothetical protein
MNMRDDLISIAVEKSNDAYTSSEIIVNSTVQLAQMTTSIRELSVLFRKMVETQRTVPPCVDV